MFYDPREDTPKKHMTEPAFYFKEILRFRGELPIVGHEFNHEHIEGCTLWEIFIGVTAWLEWAKKPGFLWEGGNHYVIIQAIRVAEWLGATEEYKKALADRKKALGMPA